MIDVTAIPSFIYVLFAPILPDPVPVSIENSKGVTTFQVQIADDAFSQTFGLMDRDTMLADAGMMFVYEESRIVQFWMKNVNFPLDLIFVDECGRVTQIHANAQPNDTTIISPDAPVRAVLEITGGASERVQIKPGDSVVVDDEIFEAC